MESNPDSSYSILKKIDTIFLESDQEKARYGLLMSIALNKNHIDTPSLHIIQPAIDYYLENGTPDEKLRTLYYTADLYFKGERLDSALNFLLTVNDIAAECMDSLTLARSLALQGTIYREHYDFRGSAEKFLPAADIYHSLNRLDSEFDCLENALSGYVLEGTQREAHTILERIKALEGADSAAVYANEVRYASRFNKKLMDSLLMHPVNPGIPNVKYGLVMANAYRLAGNYEYASQKLAETESLGVEYDTLHYHSVLIPTLANEGKYREAYELSSRFNDEWGAHNISKIIQTSQAVEEKHGILREARMKDRIKNQIIWLCAVAIVTLLLAAGMSVLATRNYKNQKRLAKNREKELELENRNLQLERDKKALEAENLSARVKSLEEESENLRSLLDTGHDELPDEVKRAIRTHMEMLNSLLASYISDNGQYEKSYETWVKEITANSQVFMNDTRLAFKASHPAFIKYLEDCGLTVDEINYVCLYAMGLKGKEVGRYMRLRSHVNLSSVVRQKLGLESHDTNIGIYIRKLLQKEMA